jgi:hypothetical protein
MTVLIVFQIVKHAQMVYPATLVNLQSHRISPEFYLFVTVLQVPIPLPILIALIVWRIVPLALTELNAPPVKIQWANLFQYVEIAPFKPIYQVSLVYLVILLVTLVIPLRVVTNVKETKWNLPLIFKYASALPQDCLMLAQTGARPAL